MKTQIAKDIRVEKEAFLSKFSTSELLWFMIVRHKFLLVCTAFVAQTTWIVVTHLPTAVSNFVR
jgi:hypothetical protein